MRKVSQKTKWDRKKKKYVSLQSTLDKNKKIKTESGQYINASYKSDLYAKWLKNSKANQTMDENENDDESKAQKKNKKYFGSSLIGNNSPLYRRVF
jgi:ATP-dependent RNA helicase DDX54/DBP10